MEVPKRSGVPSPRTNGNVRAVILSQWVRSFSDMASKWQTPRGKSREMISLRTVPRLGEMSVSVVSLEATHTLWLTYANTCNCRHARRSERD